MRFKKKIVGTFLLVALLAISFFAVLPLASAQAPITYPPMTIPTWSYLNAFPDPVGVNQKISLFAWVDIVPPTANGQYGDRWIGCTVTVTKPDGQTETLGPWPSDPVGCIFTQYTPTQVGTYQFKFSFPGETLTGSQGNPNGPFMDFSPTSLSNNAYIGSTYTGSESAVQVVTVQSAAIPEQMAFNRPTEYWTTPVSQPGHAATWAGLLGNWLGTAGSTPSDLPLSAHIAWTRPINFGGVSGSSEAAALASNGYYSYLSYEGMFNPPIVMNGIVYYNVAHSPQYGFIALDLHTGEQVFYSNASSDPLASPQVGMGFLGQNYPQLTYGQELDYESPNQHGVIDYLWSTYTMANGSSVWALYDPFTGNWICDLVNAGGGGGGFSFGASNMITDAIGSLVTYSPDAAFKTMTMWNSTRSLQDTYPSNNVVMAANGYWMWRPPLGGIVDSTNGITTAAITGNMPAEFQATSAAGPFGPSNAIGLALLGIDKASMTAVYCNATSTLGEVNYPTPNNFAAMAISIAPGSVGQVKWAKTYPMPANNVSYISGFMGDGVWTLYQKETRLFDGFDMNTGNKIWTTQQPEVDNHMYGISGGVSNGVLYSGDSIGEGGIIYAYNVQTGALLWSSTPESLGNNGYWADVPKSVANIANGYILWTGSEHSPSSVLEPGFKIGVINGQTGAKVWDIQFWSAGGGFSGALGVADGYAVGLNAYDQQIYAFGKGPTATTAQTPLAAIAKGQSCLVQGTVMDISPGTAKSDIALRFPNGVPAVSDGDETAWMEYVYMQNPRPGSASGVQVSITVIDPQGGTKSAVATSDATGTYSFQITPDMTPVTGKYTVVASFAGSNSYWPSMAESTFVVDAAGGASSTGGTQTTSIDSYFVPAVVAIILVIIIVGVAIMMMVRKKA